MAKSKTKIQLILVIVIIAIISLGHLVPVDFKVVFGFISGLTVGVYLFPRLLEARIAEEIRLIWQEDDSKDV